MSIQSVERRRASRGWCAEAVSRFLILMLALSFSVAHAATFTVTNLNDSGPGSLRQAAVASSPIDWMADLGARQSQSTQETGCGQVWEISLQVDDFSPPVDALNQPINALHAAAYGAGLYVLAEENGSILVSSDGLTWTRHPLSDDPSLRINAIVWSGNQFVAVGNGQMVFSSWDGFNWTSYPLDKDYSLNAVAWGNGQFVAVGTDGNILTSPDGIILTSPDGMTWTPRALGDDHSVSSESVVRTNYRSVISANFSSVTWGNNQFVIAGTQTVFDCNQFAGCVGKSSMILTSPDGITWTTQSPPMFSQDIVLTVVTWGNGQFVAIGEQWFIGFGYRYFRSGSILLTSSDAMTWTSHDLKGNYSVRAVTWGDGQFVAVGEQSVNDVAVGMIMTSPDGITWTPRPVGADYNLKAVTWGHGQFVAVGGQSVDGDRVGMILLSPDAMTWTPDPTGVRFSAVIWSNDRFVAIGRGSAVFTSLDGLAWTSHAIGDYYFLNAITWGNGQFVAIGSGGVILTSPDGMTWTSTTLGANLEAVTWGHDRFVAVGHIESPIGSVTTIEKGVILTSLDGMTWTNVLDDQYSWGLYLFGVTWDNSQFVAVGSEGVVLTSPDGITWTLHAGGEDYSLNSITSINNQFAAIASGNSFRTSSDGITWTSHEVGTGHPLNGIAWNGSQLIAVGDRIILRSDCSSSDDPATTLITHYYVSILERTPEPDGLAFWQGLIADRQARGEDVKPVFRQMAEFFFFSPEYLGRNTTDRQFITNLYLTFFQRTPDDGGYAFWLDQLARGMTRNQAMGGFLHSPEFTHFMERVLGGGSDPVKTAR